MHDDLLRVRDGRPLRRQLESAVARCCWLLRPDRLAGGRWYALA